MHFLSLWNLPNFNIYKIFLSIYITCMSHKALISSVLIRSPINSTIVFILSQYWLWSILPSTASDKIFSVIIHSLSLSSLIISLETFIVELTFSISLQILEYTWKIKNYQQTNHNFLIYFFEWIHFRIKMWIFQHV